MGYAVELTEDAERDLEDIFDFVAQRDSPARATQLLDDIEQHIESLHQYPNRGRQPTELLDQGIEKYRETIFKTFRIFYRVENEVVSVILISDGRREMRELLFRRVILA